MGTGTISGELRGGASRGLEPIQEGQVLPRPSPDYSRRTAAYASAARSASSSPESAEAAMPTERMWWFLDTLVIEHSLADRRDLVVLEQVLPEGASPPLHVHDGLDDSLFVLDGQIVFRRGDEVFLAEPGSWVSVPRGTPHTFRVMGRPARTLLVHDDASFRDLVRDVGSPASRRTLPEPTGGPGLDRLSQALVDHDSQVVGASMTEAEARAFLTDRDVRSRANLTGRRP
jgi:quercetin dioxygenase-like cupin family protein